MDTHTTAEADRLLDEALANPERRVYAKEKDVDRYIAERAEKLKAALDAGNSVAALARRLRATFGDVSEKTISRKISAKVGTLGRTKKKPPRVAAQRTTVRPAVAAQRGTSGGTDAGTNGSQVAGEATPPRTARKASVRPAHLRDDEAL